MRKFLCFIGLVFLVSCSGSNQHGECVGFDELDRHPNLVYRISIRNTIWSVVGFQTIVAPVLFFTDYAYCPVGLKVTKDSE